MQPRAQRKAWEGADAPRLSGEASQVRRARVLARYPLCARCHTQPSTVADHIVNLAAGGEDNEANMQGLCDPCHNAKTQVEAAQGVLRKAASTQSGTRAQWRL